MNDDPEHQWIEKIRTSRASNEARQRLFSRLSGKFIEYLLFSKKRISCLNIYNNFHTWQNNFSLFLSYDFLKINLCVFTTHIYLNQLHNESINQM